MHNINLISGLAKGMDSYTHTACLGLGDYTVAALRNGLKIVVIIILKIVYVVLFAVIKAAGKPTQNNILRIIVISAPIKKNDLVKIHS